jgi:hypothetical protein
MEIYFALLVAVIGILMYALCTNPKLQEIGRLAYACGLLVFLFQFGHIVSLLPR